MPKNFVSVLQQDEQFNPTKINANVFDDTNSVEEDNDKLEKKHELTSQAIEKITQSLQVSDELQSIINRISKLNKDLDTNKWTKNEEDNTATLRSKDARIFKQNNNLCLSHDGKIEIFKSVPELHEWLKKNNYPLPENIKLHEATEENTPFTDDPNEDMSYMDINRSLTKDLRTLYSRSRWADIIGHRWSEIDKKYDLDPEAERRRKENYWKGFNPNSRPMWSDEEKLARRMAGIELKSTNTPFGKQPSDLTSYHGRWADNANTRNEIDKMYKKESEGDRQLNSDEIWYLEYQNKGNKNYLNSNWETEDLLTDNLDNAAKFITREDAMYTLKDLYSMQSTEFPFKPITLNDMGECGVTVGGSLGSAVQYLGNKKEESVLDEDSQRLGAKRYANLNRNVIKGSKVIDDNGKIIGYVDKTVQDLYDKNDPEVYVYGRSGDSINVGNHIYSNAHATMTRYVVRDLDGKIIGLLAPGKTTAYAPNGDILGHADIISNAADKNFNLDDYTKDAQSAYQDQFTSRAMAHFKGKTNRINMYNNKGLKPQFADVAGNNPELLNRMFMGTWNDKTGDLLISPEEFENRIKEINDTYGINLSSQYPLFSMSSKDKNNPNYPEFLKWRDSEFKRIFDASRKKDTISSRISNQRNDIDNAKANQADRNSSEENQKIAFNQAKTQAKDIVDSYMNGESKSSAMRKGLKDIFNNTNYSDSIKKNIANYIKDAFKDDQDEIETLDMLIPGYFGESAPRTEKFYNKHSFLDILRSHMQDTLLTEDDTPADFADTTPDNVNIETPSDTATDTSSNSSTDDFDGYELDSDSSGTDAPSFGDINISGGMGPDEEAPQITSDKKVIDVLANDDDESEIKIKTKDLSSDEVETHDLSEIDI